MAYVYCWFMISQIEYTFYDSSWVDIKIHTYIQKEKLAKSEDRRYMYSNIERGIRNTVECLFNVKCILLCTFHYQECVSVKLILKCIKIP